MNFGQLAHDLTETLYEGVVDDGAFATFLNDFAQLNVGGLSALLVVDAAARDLGIGLHNGADPAPLEEYETSYKAIDPNWATLDVVKRGGLTTTMNVVERGAYLAGPYYNEFAKRLGDVRNTVLAGCAGGSGALAVLSLNIAHRYEDQVTEPLLRLVGHVHPHLKRVMRLRRTRTGNDARGFEEMVHGFSAPMLLYGERGELMALNGACEAMLVNLGDACAPFMDELMQLARATLAGEAPALSRAYRAGGRGVRAEAARCGPRPSKMQLLEARFGGTATPGVIVWLTARDGDPADALARSPTGDGAPA